jgi:small subunit ribosomal protein S20
LPNNLNAEKRLRQSLTRRLRNRSTKSAVRTSIKAFELAIHNKDKAAAEKNYSSLVSLMDAAAGKGVYPKNTVARKKSRLYKKLSALAAV